MQRRIAVVPLLVIGLVGACAPRTETAGETASTTAAAAANDPAAVQQQIEAANARSLDAMLKGDTATALANYTDDAVVMGPGEPMARGKDAIARSFGAMLSQFTIKEAAVHTEDVMVGGDLAVETGTFQWTLVPKTGDQVESKGKYLTVWKQQADGSWKIVRDINNSDEPPKQ